MKLTARGRIENAGLFSGLLDDSNSVVLVRDKAFWGTWNDVSEVDVRGLWKLPLHDVVYTYDFENDLHAIVVDHEQVRWLGYDRQTFVTDVYFDSRDKYNEVHSLWARYRPSQKMIIKDVKVDVEKWRELVSSLGTKQHRLYREAVWGEI